jgi:hypothetical protein
MLQFVYLIFAHVTDINLFQANKILVAIISSNSANYAAAVAHKGSAQFFVQAQR